MKNIVSGPITVLGASNNKVSTKEKLTIIRMMNGWELFTSSESRNVVIGNDKGEEILSKRVFNSMLDKWLIAQQICSPFNFILTPKAIEFYNSLESK